MHESNDSRRGERKREEEGNLSYSSSTFLFAAARATLNFDPNAVSSPPFL